MTEIFRFATISQLPNGQLANRPSLSYKQVDLHLRLPVDLPVDAGVVDDDVQRPKNAETLFERFFDVVKRRDVDSHEFDVVVAVSTFQVSAKLFPNL